MIVRDVAFWNRIGFEGKRLNQGYAKLTRINWLRVFNQLTMTDCLNNVRSKDISICKMVEHKLLNKLMICGRVCGGSCVRLPGEGICIIVVLPSMIEQLK